jgi:hypothetical protein
MIIPPISCPSTAIIIPNIKIVHHSHGIVCRNLTTPQLAKRIMLMNTINRLRIIAIMFKVIIPIIPNTIATIAPIIAKIRENEELEDDERRLVIKKS